MSVSKVMKYTLSILLSYIFQGFVAVSQKPENITPDETKGSEHNSNTMQ
jgi:hypothetical protein